jgi:hypothetical protein
MNISTNSKFMFLNKGLTLLYKTRLLLYTRYLFAVYISVLPYCLDNYRISLLSYSFNRTKPLNKHLL